MKGILMSKEYTVSYSILCTGYRTVYAENKEVAEKMIMNMSCADLIDDDLRSDDTVEVIEVVEEKDF